MFDPSILLQRAAGAVTNGEDFLARVTSGARSNLKTIVTAPEAARKVISKLPPPDNPNPPALNVAQPPAPPADNTVQVKNVSSPVKVGLWIALAVASIALCLIFSGKKK